MNKREAIEQLLGDLIDSAAVAKILGLSSSRAVSVYQRRYSAMPSPIVDLGKNRAKLWYRPEILEWLNGANGPNA